MNFNPLDLLKNADAIKAQVDKMQDELSNLRATGQSGGGLVKVTMNGKFELLDIVIDPIAVDPRDVVMLQDLIVAAVHQATVNVQESIKDTNSLSSLLGMK